jgi:RHS repeat-associated protein
LVPIQERTSSSNPTVTYTRGTDLSGTFEGAGGIGGLLARSAHAGSTPFQPNSHAFYHADGNGNVTYLTRADASAVGVYKYDPFGRTLATSGALASANRMRFSSKPWVQSASGSSGYYAYGYRFYDPQSQRWLNRDPIEEDGGINLYGFVQNAPINHYDPHGLLGADPQLDPDTPSDPSQPSECKDKPKPCPNLESQWPGALQKAGEKLPYPKLPGKITCLGAKIACESGCTTRYGAASEEPDASDECYKACIKDCRDRWKKCMGKK